MTDKEKIIHDLALIHAAEKYHEFFEAVPVSGRKFPDGITEIANFYEQGVSVISNQIDEIMDCYLNIEYEDSIQ